MSYQSLRRFIEKRNWSRRSRTAVRMEARIRARVAEVDFRRLGLIHDPGHRPPPRGMGADRGAALFAALLRLAHIRSDFGGRDRRTGVGLGILWRRPQVPNH